MKISKIINRIKKWWVKEDTEDNNKDYSHLPYYSKQNFGSFLNEGLIIFSIVFL